MTKVAIKKDSFKDRNTGQEIQYERVVIQSEKNPALVAELKLDKNEHALLTAIVHTDSSK